MEPKTAWFSCTRQDWDTKEVQADPVWADPVVDEDDFDCKYWVSAAELQMQLEEAKTQMNEAYEHASLMMTEGVNLRRQLEEMKQND